MRSVTILQKVVKDTDHRFIWYLCKLYKKLPDDDFFEDLDPIMRAWMFNSWLEDIKEEAEKDKQLGLLIGSFTNYEAVKSIISAENPDHMMSDEEFDNVSQQILTKKDNEVEPIKKRRRRRKLI